MTDASTHAITLGDRGRLVLPASLRRQLRLQSGDRLLLAVEPDGTLSLVSARERAHQLRGLFRDLAPNRSLVDELLAERRAEAEREGQGE